SRTSHDRRGGSRLRGLLFPRRTNDRPAHHASSLDEAGTGTDQKRRIILLTILNFGVRMARVNACFQPSRYRLECPNVRLGVLNSRTTSRDQGLVYITGNPVTRFPAPPSPTPLFKFTP